MSKKTYQILIPERDELVPILMLEANSEDQALLMAGFEKEVQGKQIHIKEMQRFRFPSTAVIKNGFKFLSYA